MERARLVLDTSAILSGLPPPMDAILVVPASVRDEIGEKGRSGRSFSYLLESGLETRAPSVAALSRAREAATRTGDATKMSAVDLDVVALALDLGCAIVSDDYRVQNVARELGVEARSATTRGIREAWAWTWRCRGCGRFFEAEPAKHECPVCGTEVRLVRKR